MQALVLLNDPTYVEAARALATHALHEVNEGASERLAWMFQQVLQRNPTSTEQDELAKFYERNREVYQRDPEAAKQLCSIGDQPIDATLELPQLAAWTSVARTMMNLHESITRY